jgi:hypothetical protein
MSCTRGCCATPLEHYRSIRLGADKSKRMSNGFTLAFESQESKDMEAYKRLRRNGLQPPDWTGCAELEQRAETPTEITHGTVLTRKQAAVIEDL